MQIVKTTIIYILTLIGAICSLPFLLVTIVLFALCLIIGVLGLSVCLIIGVLGLGVLSCAALFFVPSGALNAY